MKRVIHKKYSQEELAIIREMVEKYPLNLDTAFKMAQKKIGRSAHSIAQKWYKSMRDNEQTMMATITKTSVTKNRKNANYEIIDPRLEAASIIFNKLGHTEKVAILMQLPEEERFAIIAELF